ncbi:integrase [Clostridium pascui]|uniref:tyrosine-type recombinase/integrase n=1 Tax=Clostridium pascui TaxID=46609 RepID=UPI0019564F2B|nr:site-specific integrase [Clostridium pascui]MBM7872246.1 integrase [Clostridium pascui]
MSKVRSNGEGTIYKRKNGGWCAELTIGKNPLNGRLIRKSFYGKTQKEVKEKLKLAKEKLDNGILSEPITLTLKEWLGIWLTKYKKDKRRKRTFENYEYLIRIHINPHLGNIQLDKLSTEAVQDFYDMLLSKGRYDGKGGLSQKTVRNIHNLLHCALEKAVETRKIIFNATKATELPAREHKEIEVLTKEDELIFLKAASKDRLGIAFIVSLATGLRVGELLALRWQDLDLDKSILNVKQSLGRVKTFDESLPTKSKLVFGEPKTKAGKRIIPLPQNVVSLLRQHRKNQVEEILRFGTDFNKENLIFCSQSGTPIDPKNFDRKFKNILKNAGLKKINLHILRHTFATRLLELNEHPKVVQEILGHSNISITLDTYSHVLPEIKHNAAQKIDHLFASIDTNIIKESCSLYT